MIAVLAGLVLLSGCGNRKENLFDGKSLDGWICITADDTTACDQPTFSARDGVLHISGQPFGYIRTAKAYGDYRLHLEWRWAGGERVDGGIFNRLQEGDRVWPLGIQCQMTEADMGVLMGGIPMEGAEGDGFYKKTRLTPESPEKPVGEWNVMDFVCQGGHLGITMNGVPLNQAECEATSGFIGFQSEGGALDFKDIWLIPLKP